MQAPPPLRRHLVTHCALAIVACLGPRALADDGAKVYLDKCSSCHGATGEGSKEYKKPLLGDRSINQLARYIEQTMPEDDPGTVTGEEARSVAAYIHDSFYSKTAQARNKPARIELARLTVKQYRNSVADLVASFRWQPKWGDKRGLNGEYYKGDNVWNKGERVIERLDSELRFDFGTEAPGPEKFKPYQFAAKWTGTILAPETGEYEIVVRSDQGIKLYFNDGKKPLIDAWVKSGDDNDHRATVFFLAGRQYPIRVEFAKSKHGVNDKEEDKAKAPPQKASVSLEWKLANRPVEVVPARNLAPHDSPIIFVPSTPFPPDDRSIGYERGTSVSKAWDQATTDAALETVAYVAANLKELAKGDDPGKLREFALKFAERAFRRPLTDEQKTAYVTRQFDQSKDPETAVKRVVLLVLKSPRFLYREVGGPDAYDIASRLSYSLWDSIPDDELLNAAAGNYLTTLEQVKQQADRMVTDLRARTKLRGFLMQWLRVEAVPDIAKDAEKYPGFDQAIASDLRTSLELSLDDMIGSDSSDYRQLFLGDGIYLNGRLARFYGADLPPDAAFQKVALDPQERAGILTHPYLMANFAYTSTTSPIHRGVFLARSVLGRSLRPPPEAVAPLAPDLHAGLTTRERVTLQTSPKVCANCHELINPLGFAFERFDAVGRFRQDEKGKPIDADGTYEPPIGASSKFNGARSLATVLAASDEAHTAFVEQLFHFLVQQPIRAFGPAQSAELRRSFVDHQFQVRRLMVEIAVKAALPAPEKKP